MLRRNGYVTLITVLIIMMMVIAYLTSTGLLASHAGLTSRNYQYSYISYALLRACLEEGMNQIKNNTAYESGSLNLGDGSCTINVSGTGGSRTIAGVVALAEYTRTINGEVTVNESASGAVTVTLDSVSLN